MTSGQPPRKTSIGKKLLLSFSVLLIGLLAIEAAARIRMKLKFGRTSNEFYAAERDPVTEIRLPLPDQDVGFVHINGLRFRGPEIAVPRPARTIRVAFLGASTTFCAEASGDDKTWPARLTTLLDERFDGVRFDYVNSGVPGIGVPESQRNLKHRVAPLEPDVVVIYHATNDLSRDTRRLAEKAGLHVVQGDERSFLAKISVAWDLIEKNIKVKSRQQAAEGETRRLEYDAGKLATGFGEMLSDLIDEARAVAPIVVLITFSTRLRAEQSDEERLQAANTSLLYMPYMSIDGLLEGFAAYNRAIREVGTASGVLLVEGENDIPPDLTHFKDSVHFTDQGCEFMANRVLRRLVEHPPLLELVETRRTGS